MILTTAANTPAAWSERSQMPETWQACGWSKNGQHERHVAVAAALDAQPGDRLLDFGCGTGDLSAILSADVDYVGYDWATGMVIRAGKTHPGRVFQTWQPTGAFDMVACVGCFNLPDGWSKQHTWHTLRHLWDQTGCRRLVASMYAGDDPRCLTYTGAELATAGNQLSHRVTVDEIRSNDLLLTVTR